MKKRFLVGLLAMTMAAGTMACGAAGSNETADSSASAEEEEASSDEGETTQEESSEGSEAASYEGVTLTVAHSVTDSNSDSFDAQFEAFENQYGCKIEVEHLSSDADEMESVLLVRAATGNLPDVWLNSVGAKLEAMAPEDNCLDLSGESWLENINENYKSIVTDDETGAVYGVPSRPSNVAGVFYNKNVYTELGLDIPETWDELMENCQKIADAGEVTPVMAQYSNASGIQILFLSQYYYVQEEDPDFADKYTNNEIALHDSPAYMRGLEKMYEIWEKGYQNDNPLEISWEDAAKAVADGTAAHIFCRTNIMSTAMTVSPDNYENIGFFPLPDEDASVRGTASWMPEAWVINKNSENAELAKLLLGYLTTNEAIDVYCTKTVPTGAFMVNGIELPDNVTTAVKEAQEWTQKASTPVMEYVCDIKGANLPTILSMVGTGEYTPDEAIVEIEADNAIDAQQKGLEAWQ